MEPPHFLHESCQTCVATRWRGNSAGYTACVASIPVVRAQDVLRALHRDGWLEDRRDGSHVILVHSEKPGHVSVPFHQGRDLPRGTLRNILRQVGVSVDRFRRLL